MSLLEDTDGAPFGPEVQEAFQAMEAARADEMTWVVRCLRKALEVESWGLIEGLLSELTPEGSES